MVSFTFSHKSIQWNRTKYILTLRLKKAFIKKKIEFLKRKNSYKSIIDCWTRKKILFMIIWRKWKEMLVLWVEYSQDLKIYQKRRIRFKIFSLRNPKIPTKKRGNTVWNIKWWYSRTLLFPKANFLIVLYLKSFLKSNIPWRIFSLIKKRNSCL